jgi:single-stranded-DNA-specific exonuclease
LVARGWNTPALAGRFLNPNWSDILDPSRLPDFDRAIARTVEAIRRGERVMIIGDYDVDGLTATAILSAAIRIAGGLVAWQIPHRLRDGYGMRAIHVDAASQQGIRLIVTADLGIRSFSAIQHAKAVGIDVIITDHHLPELHLPDAVAIVNPTRRDSVYPNRNLCGAGIAYQFSAGLLRAIGVPEQKAAVVARSFCKLAAIGTIADVVPLVGENRAIVSLGLRCLADIRNPGLRALLDDIGIPAGRAPTARDVAFRLAPRINAAGRVEDASLIMDLLSVGDRDIVESLVARVEKANDRRKAEQARVLKDITRQMSCSDLEWPVLVFSRSGWHRGVLGIVAARLVDQHQKPVFVLSEETGLAYGSGRSIPGVDLTGLLERTKQHLEAFGGHEQAAGLTIRTERIRAFHDDICAACGDVPPARILEVDSQLHLADATRVWPEISRFEPFGNGNPEPIFATRVRVATPAIAGRSGIRRINLEQDGRLFPVKDFGGTKGSDWLTPGEHIDLAYRLQRDTWRSEGFAFVLEAVRRAV